MMRTFRGLLSKINAEAKRRGQTVDIISGYRPKDYNRKIGGAKNSNHTRAQAVDAYVGGAPIGEVWDAATFKRLGLRSGNQPGFFKGKPDPEHVDLGAPGGGADTTTEPSTGGATTTGGDPTSGTVTAGDLVDQDVASAPPPPTVPTIGPNVAQMPGTALVEAPYKPPSESWRLLAALPGASPATMRMANMASYEDTNAGS
jgi:hypothetical protein